MALSNTCVVCGRDCPNGIEISSVRICASCERRMANTAPYERGYDSLVRALRGIRLDTIALTADEEDNLEAELDTYEPMTVDELLARSGLEAQTAPASRPRRHKCARTHAARGAKGN